MNRLYDLLKKLIRRIINFMKNHLIEMYMVFGTIFVPLSVQFAVMLPHDKWISITMLSIGTFCLFMALINIQKAVKEEKTEKIKAEKADNARTMVLAQLLMEIRDELKKGGKNGESRHKSK